MPDGFEDILEDHRTVGALLDRYESERDDATAHEACTELAIHTEIEERVLYPHLRDGLPGGDELAERAELEHSSVSALIARVVAAPPIELADVMAQITEQVRSHIAFEEDELLPRLREQVDPDALAQDLAEAKRVVVSAEGEPLA